MEDLILRVSDPESLVELKSAFLYSADEGATIRTC
jgi:hypothetical protein